jgi:hypothetical protein
MAMPLKQSASIVIDESDRPFHNELAMAAYEESFRHRCLTERYRVGELRQLQTVFSKVYIEDSKEPGLQRLVDTFDLCNPMEAAKVREAVYRDIRSQAGAVACLKSIELYCRYLKDNPTVSIEGQPPLYLPSLYGPIESPVNRYTIPRRHVDRTPNRNYLEASEYKQWLKFTWSQIQPGLRPEQLLKATQLYLMCVIAGELGLRLKEILGLQVEHFNLVDGVCLVVCGKGSNGSGDRKRTVPLSPLTQATLLDFLKQFPRTKGEALFQNRHGQRLSNHTAHHWMDELIDKIQASGLSIFVDRGFGWHGFRRAYTRRYLEQGGTIFELKRNTGWAWTSTISHYLGDSKQKAMPSGPPLLGGGVGHGR